MKTQMRQKNNATYNRLKPTWNEPVASKLFVEIFKVLAIWCWGFIVVPLYALANWMAKDISFLQNIREIYSDFVTFFTSGFQTNMLIILGSVVSYCLLTFLLMSTFKRSKQAQVKRYNSDLLWNARISWKWEKTGAEYEIKYNDYKTICPKCLHNLYKEEDKGNYYLRCQNLKCGFVSEVFYHEPPSNLTILADMPTHYFHQALTSAVEANLRTKGLNK